MMHPVWQQYLSSAGASDAPAVAHKLGAYVDLLLEANQQMNLTRIDDRADAELLHIGDSLSILPFIPRDAQRLADVGSGGGLPGIPIAIARPELRVTLIDSTQKKAEFLRTVATKLQLENVTVIGERSEQLRGHQWDVVTARALSAMDKLVPTCLPLVKPGGVLLAMKGPRGREELANIETQRAIRRYRGEEPVIHEANLPGRKHLIIEIHRRGGAE